MSKHISKNSQGFTLVASLLMLVMLSGISIGLLFLVSGRGRSGGNDMESNVAYYGAESGMEKLTADLAALYQASPAPTPTQLSALANNPPDNTQISAMTYVESVTWQPDANGNPKTTSSVISQGPNAGLTAEIIPLTLQVNALRPSGANANITRGVEVALIPVFQFGVFSDSDLSYFAGPPFPFQGRVHTNGNLFLAANTGPLTLDGKITAVKEIIRDTLANGFNNGASYRGSVYVPNISGGCDTYVAGGALGPNCVDFGADSNYSTNDASWSGGVPPAGSVNSNFPSLSSGYFGGQVQNGVAKLQLPFVQGGASQIEIIRKAPVGEAPTSPTGSSREYNKANIRVLLAQTQADLHPERGPIGDGQDVNLTGGAYQLAMAKVGAGDPNWVGSPTGVTANGTTWNLIDGWIRVEYLNNAGAWVGITTQWLNLGFARHSNTRIGSAASPTNTLAGNTNAILIFQQVADPTIGTEVSTPYTQFSWYPLNFFDPREGYPRDPAAGTSLNPSITGTQCFANGVMNAVELDVRNLQRWLTSAIPGSGNLVSYTGQNGYLLYFSDRRGMLPNPNAGNITNGESGLEDVINPTSATGTPDGALQAPEDVDGNLKLDAWGRANIANAFYFGGVRQNASPTLPFAKLDCLNGGRQNQVTGARHVLRLVDGDLGNLPLRPDTGTGGFTVSSENPVYVWGNYNSNNADPFWTNQNAADIGHSAAGIIADAVTLLSNNFTDEIDMQNTLAMTNRNAAATYYRTAIAAGKNINFPSPSGAIAGQNDLGTDGGVHNFLRYIEDWGGINLYYRGSLVSLYYSQYATGIYKCCSQVYNAPGRKYFFDNEFLIPANLPPGTPMLQDVVNLTYWQNYQAY